MKKILLTCDVEIGELGKNLRDGFDIFVLGKVEGQEVGIHYINKLAAEYGASVVNFVDVYPPSFEVQLRGLCYDILYSGNEIGLHTHPGSRYGKIKMNQYSYDEQCRIIEWGAKFLRGMGIEPVCHRAKGYKINDDTLAALYANGILWDSSYYPGVDGCMLHDGVINKIFKINEVIELPITVYKAKSLLRNKIRFQKLDYRYGSSTNMILKVIRDMPDGSDILLFFHSFNFLWRPYDFKTKQFGKIEVSSRMIREFHKLLSELSKDSQCKFVKMKDLKFGKTENASCLTYFDIPSRQRIIEAINVRVLHRWVW